MKSDKDWLFEYKLIASPGSDESIRHLVRLAQADAMKEARNVLRRCWDSARKTEEMAGYHSLIAYELERRAKEIEEPRQ